MDYIFIQSISGPAGYYKRGQVVDLSKEDAEIYVRRGIAMEHKMHLALEKAKREKKQKYWEDRKKQRALADKLAADRQEQEVQDDSADEPVQDNPAEKPAKKSTARSK